MTSLKFLLYFLFLSLAIGSCMAPSLIPDFNSTWLFASMAGLSLLLVAVYRGSQKCPHSIKHLFILGLFCRVAFVLADPILENDHFRYLWDGGLTFHGVSPYGPPPSDVSFAQVKSAVREKVSYSDIRSPYPPLAQVLFVSAYAISGESILGYKILVCCLELLLFLLCLGIVKQAFELVVFYWLNPLVLKEVSGSGHFDFLIGLSVLYALKRNRELAIFPTIIASALLKVFPLAYLGVVLRRPFLNTKSMGITAAILLSSFAPFLYLGSIFPQGLLAFHHHWTLNSSGFFFLNEFVFWICDLLPLSVLSEDLKTMIASEQLVRMLAWILIGFVAMSLQFRKRLQENDCIARKILLLTLALFFLTPAVAVGP